MKFSEWLKDDTVAILDTAIYYGIPKFGHKDCYKQIKYPGYAPIQVTMDVPGIDRLCCSACGKILLHHFEVQQ